MVAIIIENLSDKLATLPFLTKVGGVVQTQQSDKFTFPVVLNTSNNCEGDYIDMLPNSTEIGVAFFELMTDTASRRQPHLYAHKAYIRLCVWINTKQLQPNNITLIESHIRKALMETNFSALPAYLTGVKIDVVGSTDYSYIYSKYNIDEKIRQYKMYPYTTFSLNLNIDYFFIDSCLPPITVTPIALC